MEQYRGLIGVVLEKLIQTHKELKFHYEGLDAVLNNHSAEEIRQSPELTTMLDLRAGYGELLRTLESRFPGVKS